MSDEDIKKALEQHIHIANYVDSIYCENVEVALLQRMLAFNDKQQAEIEKLKWEKDHFEFKVDDLNGKLEKFKEYMDIKNGADEREIERLKAEIKQAKTEAIKEFAEKVVNKLDATHDMVNLNQKVAVTDAIITVKQIAKEMAGEQNA